MNSLSPDREKRVRSAIEDYDRFIIKEEKRSADLRPVEIQKLLAQYKEKRAQLQAMLEDQKLHHHEIWKEEYLG